VIYHLHFQTSAEAEDFSFLQNVQTGPRAIPASYSMGAGVFFFFLRKKWSGRQVDHIAPKIRMSGVILLLSPTPTCSHDLGRGNFKVLPSLLLQQIHKLIKILDKQFENQKSDCSFGVEYQLYTYILYLLSHSKFKSHARQR
jgi:hypothetical protein